MQQLCIMRERSSSSSGFDLGVSLRGASRACVPGQSVDARPAGSRRALCPGDRLRRRCEVQPVRTGAPSVLASVQHRFSTSAGTYLKESPCLGVFVPNRAAEFVFHNELRAISTPDRVPRGCSEQDATPCWYALEV